MRCLGLARPAADDGRMEATWIAVIAAAVSFLSLVGTWFVAPYQRVTEKLTEDRRAAYAELIAAVDAARAAGQHDVSKNPDVIAARAKADLVSTRQMRQAALVQKYVEGIPGSDASRDLLVIAACAEGQSNSHVIRMLRRRKAYGPPGTSQG